MATELTFYVSGDAVRDGAGELFAVPDAMDEASALAFARKMARYHSEESAASVGEQASKLVDLGDLLGIPDLGNVDVERAWAPTRSGPPFPDEDLMCHWGERYLRFPVGRDMQTGKVVALDFKEPHEFEGMGHHMIIVGTTGSGKSQFLTTFITSACLTHSPEALNIAFFDFKGTATAHAIAGFPHVVAAMNNLRNDVLWLERMGDVILGELERRKMLLNKAGVGEVPEYEYLRIHKGEKLRPIPHLLIVVDEFTQMFLQHEESKAVLDEVARQGRSLGVRLVMGSQRLGHEVTENFLTNIPIRVVLRTVGDMDSRILIGTNEGNHLPVKPAGAGLLKGSGWTRLTRFQTAYVSKGYVRPQQAVPARVRAAAGYTAPQEFSVTGMEPVQDSAAAPPSAPAEGPRVLIGEDGRVVKQVEAARMSLSQHIFAGVRPMWLQPLAPLPVDELVRRLRGKAWDVDYGAIDDVSVLRFPVGIEDRPFDHRQVVYAPNLADANCAVVGQGGAGKTVAIATMIAGAALTYRPERVQFYVLSLSGPDLNVVERLPHVGGFARETDVERVSAIVADALSLIEDRERAFGELGIGLQTFRSRKFAAEAGPVPPADRFGDLFVVIDGWAAFAERFEKMVPAVMRILGKGPRYGVHAIISANGWIASKFASGMVDLLTTNVELKLSSNDDLMRNPGRVAKKVPFGDTSVYVDDDDDESGVEERQQTVRVRGRGTSMAGFHFQTGLAQMSVGAQVVDVGAGAELIAAAAGIGSVAAQVRMLPRLVTLDEVFDRWHVRGAGRAGQAPFGISQGGLAPAVADFVASPHLLVAGAPKCGVSTTLATLARSVMRVYTPEQAQIYVIDPLNDLLQVVEGDHLGDYVFQESQIRGLVERLATELESRKASGARSQAELAAELAGGARRWQGPEIFVFVDREEELLRFDKGGFQPGTGHPLAPLVPFLERREVGLHVVLGRQLTRWQRALTTPMVGQLVSGGAAGIVLAGSRHEGPIIRGTVAEENMAPGRATYVTDADAAAAQIAVSGPLTE